MRDFERFVIGDIEGNYGAFLALKKHVQKKVGDKVHFTLAGDIVGRMQKGNIPIVRYCFENRRDLSIILGNKDLLVQRIINGKLRRKNPPQWATTFAKELEKPENQDLYDLFVNIETTHFEYGNFILSHARPIQGKKMKDHSTQQLIGETSKNTNPVHEKGKVFVFGHHSKEGARINRDGNRGHVTSIQLDSGCGKGTGNLSGLLLGKKQVELLDSGGAHITIAL